MLRVSCLLAAAITSHCISLFYGHKQLWNSLSPFGASLETSASVLFTTSEPGRFPTVGGVCIVNMLWFIHIKSWISRKRTHCVVAVSMCVCTAYLCPFSLHFFMTALFDPSSILFFFHHIRRIYYIFLYLFHTSTVVSVTTSTRKWSGKPDKTFHFVWWCFVFFLVLLCEHVS